MKFNRKRCATCMYRSKYTVTDSNLSSTLHCNYACITGHTCLHREECGTVQDRRGNDFDNCLLYEKGDPPKPTCTIKF